MGEMNNRELFEMHQGVTSEGPYISPIKTPMTKQEAIKKAIDVIVRESTRIEEHLMEGYQLVTVIESDDFASVAQQIIEELGYE